MLSTRSIRRTSAAALLAGSAAMALVAMAPDAAMAAEPGAGTTVKLGRPTWDTNWFQTAIYAQMLEKLGYKVTKPTTLDNPVLFQSIAQGDIDFETGAWVPIHSEYIDKVKGKASLVGYVVKKGALSGYLIDKKTADKYNITNLKDFNDPKIAKLFDNNGDGKADLVACPPGWGCELTISWQLDAYKLHDTVEPIKAAYAASMADALARYKQGKPIFFYTWTPNWTVAFLKPGIDVVWLEVPFTSLPPAQKALEQYADVPGVKGCVGDHDPCKMGWPANDISVIANNDFLAKNPAAKKLFEEASVPLDAIFAQNAEMHEGKNSEKAISDAASKWISDNQSTVNGWLDAARKAAK